MVLTWTNSSGVNVPGVRMVDAADGVLGIEWIEGQSVRRLLPGGAEEEHILEQDFENEEDSESGDLADPLKDYRLSVGLYHFTCSSFFLLNFLLDALMGLVGTEIAKMHLADIIHGDLTTSNMMLRHPSSFAAPGPGLQTELVSCSS